MNFWKTPCINVKEYASSKWTYCLVDSWLFTWYEDVLKLCN